MSLPDPHDTECNEYNIAFLTAKQTYTRPLRQDEEQEYEYNPSEHQQPNFQDFNERYPKQPGNLIGPSTDFHPLLESLKNQEPIERPPTPRRTQSWSMEDQKHEFHRRLMELGSGVEAGFSET